MILQWIISIGSALVCLYLLIRVLTGWPNWPKVESRPPITIRLQPYGFVVMKKGLPVKLFQRYDEAEKFIEQIPGTTIVRVDFGDRPRLNGQ